MKTLTGTPAADGFHMPAEWAPQQQIWMLWPERPDNWRLGAKPAQAAFTAVALAIARFELVTVGVSAAQFANACRMLDHPDIRVVEIASNDAWIRDTGPTFITNGSEVRCVDWEFNAWGGLKSGLYFPWDQDEQVAAKVAMIERCPRYRTEGFVLEGGSIHVDGEGTLLTTEECLLNSNRNPHMKREQIEHQLEQYLGISKTIWLPEGLFSDETDGHVDNFCCFVRPGEVALAWTDDEADPNFPRCRSALARLDAARDAAGRQLIVHKMPIPGPLYASADECAGVDHNDSSQPRDPSIRLAGSYINYLLVNGGVIMPQFDDPADRAAMELMQALYPEREVVSVPGREILLGGGNIHCITQQQPLA
ncbi:Agmatine deiminase [Marinobacterium lacunae]|uniref:Putative agmatine deiminase n=1 Tax=Marinobacterium lacunae TaxID=1232683 RepID=A0A081FX96_9GAMM|nr:agmatine deiminase [Marinobacterium lacunae]KEA63151.1 Agmatine deiminase [Marinobacterium lacunae]